MCQGFPAPPRRYLETKIKQLVSGRCGLVVGIPRQRQRRVGSPAAYPGPMSVRPSAPSVMPFAARAIADRGTTATAES
jgi:hypothetical protein